LDISLWLFWVVSRFGFRLRLRLEPGSDWLATAFEIDFEHRGRCGQVERS
jgi:hypothetical protein